MVIDDEPLDVDIDTADLPEVPDEDDEVREARPFTLVDSVRWVVYAGIFGYIVIGLIVGAFLAVNGAAEAGPSAFAKPGFYLLVFF